MIVILRMSEHCLMCTISVSRMHQLLHVLLYHMPQPSVR